MPCSYFFLRYFLFALMVDLSEKTETLTRMRLISNNTINENMVVFSVPGMGFLSLRIYPKIAKTRTVTETARVKIAEDVSSILVDL